MMNKQQAATAIFTSPENRELLKEAIRDFGDEPMSYKYAVCSLGYADCTIRCYLLGECIHRAIERIKETKGN